MSTRRENERQFPSWEDLPDGGRRYWYERRGRVRGRARYVKIVDANEKTVSFVQEVYDDQGKLIMRHQKYPQDTGHEVVSSEDQQK